MNKPGSILITGASRGIGLEAAKWLLEAGWKVIGTRNKSTFPTYLERHADFTGVQVDLSSADDLRKLESFFDEMDAVDVLVNNAGVFEPVLFSEGQAVWDKKWKQTLNINLIHPATLCKWAVNGWKKASKSGIIINITSRAAYRGETAEYSSYAASKAGLTALTKTLARGFGRDNIFAYTIAPGFVHTDMAADSVEVYGEEYLTKDLALDKIVPPKEVGELIGTLASGKFKHMTGSTLHINSGSYMI